METQKWEAVAAHIKKRHKVKVADDVLIEHIRKCFRGGHYSWSDATWDMWLKNRITELNAWPSDGVDFAVDTTVCVFHFFFLSLDETPEMYLLIKQDKKASPEVARSKISKTSLVIHPIDSVAQRVAPKY